MHKHFLGSLIGVLKLIKVAQKMQADSKCMGA